MKNLWEVIYNLMNACDLIGEQLTNVHIGKDRIIISYKKPEAKYNTSNIIVLFGEPLRIGLYV